MADQTSTTIVSFPHSRVRPERRAFRDLGLGPLARQLGAPAEQCTGHWCSRCRGIWFGYLLEVTCPQCGGRHG
ncbi:hypothetical protein [Zavarzinia compransoris]|uniref:Uncharacterized protein n=1 Tax=Zavarzinia compransoris TaxID=1264899 RepID=A0A317EAD3_9PROT|nr:hypothetical protein [Zavarzinia compransoris]PWR23110.1 hypothetical protein DKG75_00620 [Zavarzinia compransoris]TDP46338.1 hypothetical protein DES42_104424 [Zavarzinia compransoris]